MSSVSISYIDFNRPGQRSEVADSILRSTHPDAEGYCIVRNRALDAHDFMMMVEEEVAPSFSHSSLEGRRVPYDLVMDRNQEHFDPQYSTISASNLVFPLHTDCAYLERPADLVTLYCQEQAAEGGDSLLLHLGRALDRLSPDYVDLLLRRKFRVYSHSFPILEQREGRILVRFSDHELMGSYSGEEKKEVDELLTPLLALLRDPDPMVRVRLLPDDCLLVNNRTCLHGRTAFEKGSRRVFLRARHYWK